MHREGRTPAPRGHPRPGLLPPEAVAGAILLLLSPLSSHAGVLDLAWDAPTTNTDGTPLTDLSSYRIYFGTSSNPCQGPSVQHVPSPSPAPTAGDVVTSRLAGLTAGAAYYVQVTALDNNGNESLCSDQATGVATADGSDSTAPETAPTDGGVSGGTGGVPVASGGGDGGAGGGGGCFIATAAYGSPLAPQVRLLRRLRDRYLVPRPVGQLLVTIYYRISPPLADVIAGSPTLRAIVRMGLVPILGWAALILWSPVLGTAALLLAVTLAAYLTKRFLLHHRGP